MTSEIEFEQTSCNLCGSTEFEPYLTRGDLYVLLPGNFTLVRCRHCQLIYQNPRPVASSWDLIYPSSYDQYNPKLTTEKFFSRISRQYGLKKRAKFINGYKTSGKLLDVGCASGDFLGVMSTMPGWKVTGIEPHPEASSNARSFGLDVKTGTLDDLKSSDLKFDVITLWHVIEHLYDPLESLKIVHQLLQPGGIVVLATPDLNSLDARLFGQYWVGFELPRHFYIYSNQTMKELLERAGFRLMDIRRFYGSHAAFMSSVRFWLRRNGQKRIALENILFSLPVRIALAPIFYIFDRLKLSSPVTFVAVKQSANEK